MRTIGPFVESLPGAEYTQAGIFTGTTFINPICRQLCFDSATDGVHNYLVEFGFPSRVYQTDADYTDPVLLFTTGQPRGAQLAITYDPVTNSLWIGDWDEQHEDGVVENRTLGGVVLSSFATPVGTIASLAMDYDDHALWFGTQDDIGGPRTLYQFSTLGVLLSTDTYPALAGHNYLGGEFAFEGAFAVPEPATLTLLGLGLIGIGRNVFRRRARRRLPDRAPTVSPRAHDQTAGEPPQ